MTQTVTLLDLESMVDDTLDDIREAPDYINPPAGDYTLMTKAGKITKYVNDKTGEETQNILVTIATVEALELVSSEEPPVPDGSLFTVKYKGTMDGVGKFKRDIRKMAGLSSTNNMSLSSAFELLESGLEFQGRISYSAFQGRDYLNLKVMPTVAKDDIL